MRHNPGLFNYRISIVSSFFIFLINVSPSWCQINGKIVDTDGLALPFAAIYIEGTTYGTVSNADGYYELEIAKNGKTIINFQYVGFKNFQATIDYKGVPVTLNVTMAADQILLNELVIRPDAEDPAYPIMRQTIAHRKTNKNIVNSLEADLYVKGLVKLLEVPQKILGEEVGNLNGILDSLRQGIIYLSESKSRFYFELPDKTKEEMISTIKSGDNSLFTANQFSWASFDLYEEYLQFGRSIISPLADNAFAHYTFRLEQTYEDKDNFVIHKIRIIPKSKNAPLLNGYIFITDGYWTIHSTDLKLYGVALKNTYIDTIEVKQVFIPVESRETWKMFSQIFRFKAGLLGFKIGGDFTYIFSNYILNPDITGIFKSKETFSVKKDALKRDTAYWNQIRPVPLTMEEEKDYIKKDSLLTIWSSRSFLDSMDRADNKFKPIHLILGYTHNNSYKKRSFTVPSPLSAIKFNAVEGFVLNLNPYWAIQDTSMRKFKIQPSVSYGFADHTFKPAVLLDYTFDNYSLGRIQLFSGLRNSQFDAQNPINERSNAWSSLWSKTNKIRLYREMYAGVNYFQEIFNGFYTELSSTYTSRSPVGVNTQYSFRKKDLKYEENIPNVNLPESYFIENEILQNQIKITLRPGQTYSSYPNYKIRHTTDRPVITAEYILGIPINSDRSPFQKLTVKVRDQNVNLRQIGYFRYNIEGGLFIKGKPGYFADFLHPVANRIAIPIDPDLSSFNLLPFYQYSTDRYYIQFNYRHHFNGFVFDKIPLINKTPLRLTLGTSGLYVPDKGYYLEPFIGIENFKIGPIHLFDIDYAFSFDKNGFRDHGIVFRLSQLLGSL
ncbi:MAG: carboxypeptidase-like regulatory domain-containing protein [Saprospiraceae bacterium]|nr:carboxypeptidase-like regulatory domain-containing protein [Saprospiraceae bacterium]